MEKALEEKTHMHFEYLYTIQDDIRKWESILKHRPFDFLTIRNIKRSFEEGHTNEWIRIFKNLKSYNVKNSVAQRVWKALQKHEHMHETGPGGSVWSDTSPKSSKPALGSQASKTAKKSNKTKMPLGRGAPWGP